MLRARDKSSGALEALCGNYREPLIAWLRARGYAERDREDLVHDFLGHILTSDFPKNVAQPKGKFRTFLLKPFQNFLSDKRDRSAAAKRGGGAIISSLDESVQKGHPRGEPASDVAPPDVEYDRAWARATVDNALRRLEEARAHQGRQTLYSALEPVLFADDTAPTYREIASALGMSEGAVKTAVCRLRERLKGLICDEVQQTAATKEDLKDELHYLIQLFAG